MPPVTRRSSRQTVAAQRPQGEPSGSSKRKADDTGQPRSAGRAKTGRPPRTASPGAANVRAAPVDPWGGLPPELFSHILSFAPVETHVQLMQVSRHFRALLGPYAPQLKARVAVRRLPALRDPATGEGRAVAADVRRLMARIVQTVDATMRKLPLCELQLKASTLMSRTARAVAGEIEGAIVSLGPQRDGPWDEAVYALRSNRLTFERYAAALEPVEATPDAMAMRMEDLGDMATFGAYLATQRPKDIGSLDGIIDAPEAVSNGIVADFLSTGPLPKGAQARFADQVQWMRWLMPRLAGSTA